MLKILAGRPSALSLIRRFSAALSLIAIANPILKAQESDESSTAPAAKEEAIESLSLSELLEVSQKLWETHAPAELQEAYRLPTFEELVAFLARFEASLTEGGASELAAYAPEAKLALATLRNLNGGDALANWLEPRIDFLIAAQEIEKAAPPQKPKRAALPLDAPQFTQKYWNETMAKRARPQDADRYMPVFKKAFASKGVPTELAWLSEVESSINLNARSPVGAYGPFQFMPVTAERFGLQMGSPDDRTHPEKSSAAAATYLGILYKRFESWPLALAAYNAGEGRVSRALKKNHATSFDEVSIHLPAETRMFVPKVLATIAAREAIDPTKLTPAL